MKPLPKLKAGDRVLRRAQVLRICGAFGFNRNMVAKLCGAEVIHKYALPGVNGKGKAGKRRAAAQRAVYLLSDLAVVLGQHMTDLVPVAVKGKL